MEELYGVTKEEWFGYEELRRSGKTNMWGAERYLGFSPVPIMEHYAEMKEAWMAEFESKPEFQRGELTTDTG